MIEWIVENKNIILGFGVVLAMVLAQVIGVILGLSIGREEGIKHCQQLADEAGSKLTFNSSLEDIVIIDELLLPCIISIVILSLFVIRLHNTLQYSTLN